MSRLAEALARASSSASSGPAKVEESAFAKATPDKPVHTKGTAGKPEVVEPPAAERPSFAEALADRKAGSQDQKTGERKRLLVRAPADLMTRKGPVHINPALVGKLVGTGGMLPGCIEQYRKISATLHHLQMDRDVRVLLVSSAVAGEGKTLTTTNIALTLSQSYGRRVLVIDGDLRRPTMHQVFDLPNAAGLSDGLRAEHDRSLPLIVVGPRLAVLTAGRPDPDPMSGITSARMGRIIEQAKDAFDWIFVDTPPIGLLPDARLLAAHVDAALMVVHAGKSPVQLIARAVESLGRERIIGVVLNGLPPSDANARSLYGYGYGYGYGYYGPRPGEPSATE